MTPPQTAHGAATLAEAVANAVDRWSDRPAMSWCDRTLTYADLGRLASDLGRQLAGMGLQRGDRVLCRLANRPELLLYALAAWSRGAIHGAVDADLTDAELTWYVQTTRPAVLVVERTPSADVLARLRAESPGMRLLRLDPIGTPGTAPLAALLGRDLLPDPDAAGLLVDPTGVDDPAVILFTSGTTAEPKAVVRYQGQILDAWQRSAATLASGPEDVHLVHLPLSHGFGFGLAVAALLTGGKLVMLDRFSVEATLRTVQSEHVSVLHGTPTHFTLLSDRCAERGLLLPTLRIGMGSAASFSPELIRKVFDVLGMDLILVYGSSEGLGWITRDREAMLDGSVGVPPQGTARVVGPDGDDVVPGHVGEICIRRRASFHYWGERAGAAKDPESPWYHTGDVGRVDGQGRIYVLGRVKHQVSRGGLRVDPGELESLLARHPDLADVAVVGLPDRVLGQVVCACVVLKGADVSLDDLRSFLAPSLAKHKLPERICALDGIPRTQLGKIDRTELQALADSKMDER